MSKMNMILVTVVLHIIGSVVVSLSPPLPQSQWRKVVMYKTLIDFEERKKTTIDIFELYKFNFCTILLIEYFNLDFHFFVKYGHNMYFVISFDSIIATLLFLFIGSSGFITRFFM